jgi:hypothetical protein
LKRSCGCVSKVELKPIKSMKFPRIQILSDKKSFNDFFELDAKGSWRGYSASAVSIISTVVANVERSLIDIDVVLYGKKQEAYKDFDCNPFVQILQRDGHYSPIPKKLSDFDKLDVRVTGRLIEFNSSNYDKNRKKMEELGRLCVNLSEEKQVVDFLGLLFYKSSGDTIEKSGEFSEPIRWKGETQPPAKSLLVANSYMPTKWLNQRDGSELLNRLGNDIFDYSELILGNHYEQSVNFSLLTKKRSAEDFKEKIKPYNLTDQLIGDVGISLEECEACLDNHSSGVFQNSRVLLSHTWHHRKIFSEYWSIFTDDSIGSATTYTIHGMMVNPESYYYQLYEMNRNFDNQLIPFIESNKVRQLIYQ